MKLIAIIIATALCCVGCANNQSIREAVSASPQPTYQHLSKIPFEALVKGAPRLEEITTQTPAFPFSEGTSYFKAYALPTANDRNIHLTTFIVGSMNMPAWAAHDPQLFWEASDDHERERGSTYREFELALPRELTAAQRVALVEDFIGSSLAGRHVVQWAIHCPRAALEGGEDAYCYASGMAATVRSAPIGGMSDT